MDHLVIGILALKRSFSSIQNLKISEIFSLEENLISEIFSLEEYHFLKMPATRFGPIS